MFSRLLIVAGALVVPIALSVSSQLLAETVQAPDLGGTAVSVAVTETVDPAAGGSAERGLPREVLQDPRSGTAVTGASPEGPASPEAPSSPGAPSTPEAPSPDPDDDAASTPASDDATDVEEVGDDDDADE